MESVAFFVMVFLFVRLMVVFANLVTRPWLPSRDHHLGLTGLEHIIRPVPDTASMLGETPDIVNRQDNDIRQENGSSDVESWKPIVSVLIPARNEALTIGTLLHDISCHDYHNMEVLVYDDLSEDRTADVVMEAASADPRIRLISGRELPAGWLGKNHACHVLAQHARGDFLLFLDADVSVGRGLIVTALRHVNKHRLDLLSIFPQQIMRTLAERLTVPLMNWVLASLLPLKLTRLSPWPAFSAANGQFMLFDAQVYRQHEFHKMVRQHKVEDIVIFRQMKKMKLRVETQLSNGMISCRMYKSFNEALNGFSKNVFGFFGGQGWLCWLFALITTFGFLSVWAAFGIDVLMIFLATTLLLRLLVSITSRQPVFPDIFLAPFQQISFLMVVLTATRNKLLKKTTWKGRLVY